MVWIHGGGNTIGTANTYDASLLAGSEQVVVVTINYRLGFFGWMSHPALRTPDRNALDASGNYANLDMIAALQWVSDNIANFGGDQNNVTIFGESAGGRNVFSLMASPLAKGLFHRAIAQSGSVGTTPLWRAENFHGDTQPGQALSSREWLSLQLQNSGRAKDSKAARAAQMLMSEEETRDFMYSRSAQEILEGVSGGAGMYQAPQSFRDGTVLPKDTLYKVFSDPSRYNSVPLITGTNRDEAKLFLALNPEFVELRFGFLPRVKDLQAYNEFTAYLSDSWKAMAVDGAADIIAANSSEPVFAYRWDWDEGGDAWLVNWSTALGAAHGMELPFVFGDFERIVPIPLLFNNTNRAGAEHLSSQMMAYWANFARSGEPGRGAGTAPLWQAWDARSGGIMLLDTEADGGVRASSDLLSVPNFTDRLIKDASFSTVKERCVMFVDLFYTPRRGREFFDRREYERLGCAKFDAAALVGVSGR
jgi:para-nitrobenzyl esterase